MARHVIFDGVVDIDTSTVQARPANTTRSGLILENQSAVDMAYKFRSNGGSESVTMPGTGADDGRSLPAGAILFLSAEHCAAGDLIVTAASGTGNKLNIQET